MAPQPRAVDGPARAGDRALEETDAPRGLDDGQDRGVGSFRVPLATLNRHAFVTGATGSGKSQTVRHMLEQLSRARIPWLAIEPAKSEYAAMAASAAQDPSGRWRAASHR